MVTLAIDKFPAATDCNAADDTPMERESKSGITRCRSDEVV
jgi:hypothetical protein